MTPSPTSATRSDPADKPSQIRVQALTDPEWHRQLKIETARAGVRISDLIRDLLSQWMEERQAEGMERVGR